MTSIGNDIIALKLTNAARTQQQRFYLKILTEAEVDLYGQGNLHGLSFQHFVWLAWSIKESVYKFQKRAEPGLLFGPVKIVIRQINASARRTEFPILNTEDVSFNAQECYCCVAEFSGKQFYTKSIITDDVIFTIADDSECFSNVYWGVKQSPNQELQSLSVKNFALNKLSNLFEKDFVVNKTSCGIPFIENQSIPISFSHHGDFIAYAFKIS